MPLSLNKYVISRLERYIEEHPLVEELYRETKRFVKEHPVPSYACVASSLPVGAAIYDFIQQGDAFKTLLYVLNIAVTLENITILDLLVKEMKR